MSLRNKIVAFAKSSIETPTNVKAELEIGAVSIAEAEVLNQKFNADVRGYVRKIDNFGVIHVLRNHGIEDKERRRGQVAITVNDFAIIPDVAQARNVVYMAKNKLGRDCLVYSLYEKGTYYYVEEIRTGRKELVLNTMYKLKPPQ